MVKELQALSLGVETIGAKIVPAVVVSEDQTLQENVEGLAAALGVTELTDVQAEIEGEGEKSPFEIKIIDTDTPPMEEEIGGSSDE